MTDRSVAPLADLLRPQAASDVIGQDHVLGQGEPLRLAIDSGRPHSMVFWGPPGCGKTTLARIVANSADAELISLSAVLSGVKDIRAAVEQARISQSLNRSTVLFVDEVHRFNKSQQDAFLPHVESGLITFIGATTENPSFELNNALLSRVKVYVLKSLDDDALRQLVRRGAGHLSHTLSSEAVDRLVRAADGDGRRALNFLELAAQLSTDDEISADDAGRAAAQSLRRFDKGGDLFHDQISALHKSVRSSNPDAALYWLCRMLDGGCDPRYLARRITRMATEDIGNADPRAIRLTLDAWETFERLGSPEGELALGQAVIYLACCAKSNAGYTAFKAATRLAKESGSLDVPMALRNAPTRLMKDLGFGADYQYDHDVEGGVALGQNCFPEQLGQPELYQPTNQGLEIRIGDKLDKLRARRMDALKSQKDDNKQ